MKHTNVYLVLASMFGAANAQWGDGTEFTVGGYNIIAKAASGLTTGEETCEDHTSIIGANLGTDDDARALCELIFNKYGTESGLPQKTWSNAGWESAGTPGGCWSSVSQTMTGTGNTFIWMGGNTETSENSKSAELVFCIKSPNNPTCDTHTCTAGTNKGAGVTCAQDPCDEATCCDLTPQDGIVYIRTSGYEAAAVAATGNNSPNCDQLCAAFDASMTGVSQDDCALDQYNPLHFMPDGGQIYSTQWGATSIKVDPYGCIVVGQSWTWNTDGSTLDSTRENYCACTEAPPLPTCDAGFTCDAGHSIKDNPESITCGQDPCDNSDCCDADPIKCATFSGCADNLVLYDTDCPAGGCDEATCCATTFNSAKGFAVNGDIDLKYKMLIAVQQGCAAVGAKTIPSNTVVVGQAASNTNTGTIQYIWGPPNVYTLPDGFTKPNGGNLLFNGHEVCFFCDGYGNDNSRYQFMNQIYSVDTSSADDFCNEVSTNYQCTQKSCLPPPPECTDVNGQACQHGGTVKGTIDPNDNDDCRCECPAGYDGPLCENDIDDCASNPCQNGGSCTDKVNGFECACAVGYEGNTCQDPKDCSLDGAGNSEAIACQNGGTANGQTGSCTCNCAAGYEGNLCQTETQCTANDFTCHNGRPVTGTIAGGCGCDCGADFLGVNCQTARDCKEEDIPCANGMDPQGQYDANNPKHGGCTCDCQGFLTGFYCEVDSRDIEASAITTRKSTARAKADKKALRQDLKAIAKDLLAVKLVTEPDLKKAIRETRVDLVKDDFSFQMKKLLRENIKMAVGPTNDAAEQDDCQAAGAAADGSCGMLDLNADADGEQTLISTAGENSYTIVVDGNTVISKQVQTANGFDMQCWETDDWGAATSFNLDELSPAEDRLFQCNGRIVIVGSQGALCTESSCSGNGACHPHGTSFICVCHSGYEGTDCSVLNNGNSQNCTEAETNNDRIAYQNLQCGCDC